MKHGIVRILAVGLIFGALFSSTISIAIESKLLLGVNAMNKSSPEEGR